MRSGEFHGDNHNFFWGWVVGRAVGLLSSFESTRRSSEGRKDHVSRDSEARPVLLCLCKICSLQTFALLEDVGFLDSWGLKDMGEALTCSEDPTLAFTAFALPLYYPASNLYDAMWTRETVLQIVL